MAINYKVVPLLKSFQEIISPTIITYKGKLFKIYSMFEHISTRRKFMKIKVLFICHGNICRSPMAEFIMKDRVKKEGLEDKFEINSMALSSEETGNDMYYAARDILDRHNIPCNKRKARKFVKADYDYYDHIYLMDQSNMRLILDIVEDYDDKIELLNGYISDPWYTRDFESCYRQIEEGVRRILEEYR